MALARRGVPGSRPSIPFGCWWSAGRIRRFPWSQRRIAEYRPSLLVPGCPGKIHRWSAKLSSRFGTHHARLGPPYDSVENGGIVMLMLSRRNVLLAPLAAPLAQVIPAVAAGGKMSLSIHQTTSRNAGYRKILEGWAKAGIKNVELTDAVLDDF